jgi:hypothetical protein
MRFVPVKLRLADVAVFDEANERDALEFTPTCFSISFLQVTKDRDSLVNRNGFDLGEFADDLEVRARKILSRPLLPQTLLLEATNPLRAPGIAVGLRFITLQAELSALFGRRVDLVTAGFLSPHFRPRVVQEAVPLYEAA